MTIPIEDLETVAAAGWRAPEEHHLGDWLLRAAGGFTGRANSALAVGDPGVPLPTAVNQVCHWYTERDLPAMIAVPFPAQRPDQSELDRTLADAGWTVRPGVSTVMTALSGDVAATASTPGVTVDIDAHPDEAWLACHRSRVLPPVALRLLTSAPWQVFASVRNQGRTIAIGRVAVSSDWAGLTTIEVDPAHRRQGLAIAVTIALASAARAEGVSQLYLQVEDDNVAARALYQRIGFADHHGYHYRLAPA